MKLSRILVREGFLTGPDIRKHIIEYDKTVPHEQSFMRFLFPEDYSINAGDTVSVKNNTVFTIRDEFLIDGKMPFKFLSTGSLLIDTQELRSYEGFPRIVHGSLAINAQSFPNSFEGFPEVLCGPLIVVGLEHFSLEGIHKHLKMFKPNTSSLISIHTRYHKGLLSALLIENCKGINTTMNTYNDTGKAVKIVNNHLRGERDVVSCKRELIAAGLKEFAKV